MKYFHFFLALFTIVICAAHANDGVCKKCEIIREQNKHCTNNYEYYEDYLKDQKESQLHAQPQPDSAPQTEKDN